MAKRVRRVAGSRVLDRRRARSGRWPRSSSRKGRSSSFTAVGGGVGAGLVERLRRKASEGRDGLL